MKEHKFFLFNLHLVIKHIKLVTGICLYLNNDVLRSHYFDNFAYIPLNPIKPLTPNDPYMGRTAPLTSKRYILYIYSTNIDTGTF